MKGFCLVAALALTACDALPRDAAGTSERIAGGRTYRVGLIAGSGANCPDMSRAFLIELGRRAGATDVVDQVGAAEPLINELRRGELDLVLGEVAHDSPWKTDVSMLEPLATGCPGDVDYAAIARDGENRWIMLLEDVGRTVRAHGARS